MERDPIGFALRAELNRPEVDDQDPRDDFSRRMKEDGEYEDLRRQDCLAKCEAKYRRQDQVDRAGGWDRMP